MSDMKDNQPCNQDILIVEDSPTQAQQLKFTLESQGYCVTWRPDAESAWEFMDDHFPNIVISDVMMPGKDGFELCADIKKNERLRRIPVMLLTTLSEPQDIIRGLECGADNFIIKPYKKDYLLSQVNYMLANSQLRKLGRGGFSEMADMGIEIYFAGKKHYITSSQLQILDLLFSTFEVFVEKNKELEAMNRELVARNDRIKALQGLIPICANCKKIRDDAGYWMNVDRYLEEHSEAGFNRSVCPACLEQEQEVLPKKENKKDKHSE